MLPFAITQRELLVSAKSRTLYRNRLIAALIAFLIAAIVRVTTSAFSAPAASGAVLFKILMWLAFVACLLEGPRKTADCLANEKREGTLELLFLTDLRSWQIVLGKFTGAALPSFYLLLSSLPILRFFFN